MSEVNVNINEAAVTAVHEFNSFKGYGVDFFIEVHGSNGTVYLQVVVYDDTARRYSSYIHVGDHVSVIGDLKVKSYAKKDRTAGTALIIERPVTFFKIVSGNSEQQLLQDDSQYEALSLEDIIEAENAATAAAISAENKVENNENSQSKTAEAEIALQNPQAETAEQQITEQDEQIPRIETKQYPPLHFLSGYRRPTIVADEDELPF